MSDRADNTHPQGQAHRPPIPGPLGRIIEHAYRWEISRRNRAFDASIGVRAIDRPVISVGNLSVGGTGKTPMVRTIVGWLIDAGHQPAIALRGYKAKRGISDEAAEYQREIPGTPIALGPDRFAAIQALRQRLGPNAFDTIVLDDAFQHRRLHRDLDIVLLDATRWPFRDRCLPAGWLREPPESLARAHIAIITRADRATQPNGWQAGAEQLRQRFPDLLIGACIHRWDGLHRPAHPEPIEPLDWLNARPTVVACGIGNPGAFVAQAIAAGATIHEVIRKPDHHDWSAADARHLAAALEHAGPDAILLTTLKDWVKLEPIADDTLRRRTALPRLSLRFLAGEAEVRQRILLTDQSTAQPAAEDAPPGRPG